MTNKMEGPLKYTAAWGSRKNILQGVSLLSTAILCFLMYGFAQQRLWLYFSATGAALLLAGWVFFLLLKEIQTGKKLAERLRTQREYYRITISSMAEGLVTTDHQGEIRYMNPAAERMTGWKLDEAKNLPLQTVYSVVNEETGEPLEHIVSRILRNRQKVEFENNTVLNTKEKGKLIIRNSGSPLFDNNGNMTGAMLVFNDITEKKKTEAELKESEKQYRSLIQNLPEAMYTCDAEGYIKLFNKAATVLWGREPITGEDRWCGSCKILNTGGSTLHPDNFPVKRVMTERRPLEEQEIIIQRPDGSSSHVLSYPSPLFDASGQLTGAVNILIDVTEKKEKEVLLKHSEEKYRSMIEEASDAILIHSFDGTIHEFNKRCYVLLGYSQEEYALLKLNDILVEDIIVNQANYAAVLAGDTKTVYRHLKRKDGSVIEAEVTVKLMADGRVISFTRDITERRTAEEAIRKEKNLLESVINSLPGIFYLLDQNLSVIRWNKNFETVSGYNAHEIADMHAYDFFDEEEKRIMPEKIRDVMTKGEVYRYANFCTKEHKKIPYYFTGFKMENEGEIQIVGMGLDITELKDTETKMKTAIERYDILARATSDTIWDWDMVSNNILYNEGITQMFGYQSSEVENIVDWWIEKLHPDDVKKLVELLNDI
ncbi:MAG: PAS domain S-box protein, partial [Chitinophagaceae bacterium]